MLLTFRSASIRTITRCVVGEIKKKDYNAIFEASKKNEMNDEIKFFKSTKLFKDCNKAFIEKFSYYMEHKEYSGGDFIIKQGDPIDSLFIVRRGLFQVFYKKKDKIETEFDINYFSNLNRKDRFTDRRAHEIKGYISTSDDLKLLVLGPGDIFGDVEMLKKSDKSLFTIICNQKGSVLYQAKKDVSKLLNNIRDSLK